VGALAELFQLHRWHGACFSGEGCCWRLEVSDGKWVLV